MDSIKVFQFNADRGRQVTDLAEREFLKNYDLALIQEPYLKFIARPGYQRIRTQGNNAAIKAEIWAKDELDVTVMLQNTKENYVTVKLNGRDPFYITSLYDEPGGNTNKRLEELMSGWNSNFRKKHLIGGDFNAHCSAWGRDEDDRRGEKLLDWAISNNYVINNEADQGPTFTSFRGGSHIDLTLTLNTAVEEWKIEDEVTLSGHKYVTYKVLTKASQENHCLRF